MSKIIAVLRSEPAALYVTGLGVIASLIVAFGHLTTVEAGTLAGLTTAVGSAITAALTQPADRSVPIISGAAGTILESLTLFNVHLSSGEISAVVAGVNLILGYIAMRPQITPTVKTKLRPAPVDAAHV